MSSEVQESHSEAHHRSLTSSDARLRRIASWVTMFGTALFAAYFFGFLIYHSLRPTASSGSWLITTLDRQFAATIGVPLSAISSVCIILLLKATAGPIEFEGLGFKFRGASGPIVLWVFCFLSMIFAEHLLWKP
jgi:hypothetical protein